MRRQTFSHSRLQKFGLVFGRPSGESKSSENKNARLPDSRHADRPTTLPLMRIYAVAGKKPAEAAARKQQRLLPIIGIGFDGPQEDDVIAAIISIGGSALEIGDAVGEDRRVAKSRRPIHAGKFVARGFRKLRRQRLLRGSENIDREMAGVLEDGQALRKHAEAPQHQRRIQRYRGKRVAGHPIRLSVGRHRRDDGDAGGERAKRIAKIPGIDRRIVAGKFIGRIGRMFGCVGHPPASERQVFGRQAKRHTSIIGSCRIEIECEVRIHRVGIAKLPLQCA